MSSSKSFPVEMLSSFDLGSSEGVTLALEQFFIEALDEAIDLMRTGDIATRIQLIKAVLSMATTAKKTAADATAGETLSQTRDLIMSVLR